MFDFQRRPRTGLGSTAGGGVTTAALPRKGCLQASPQSYEVMNMTCLFCLKSVKLCNFVNGFAVSHRVLHMMPADLPADQSSPN